MGWKGPLILICSELVKESLTHGDLKVLVVKGVAVLTWKKPAPVGGARTPHVKITWVTDNHVACLSSLGRSPVGVCVCV